MPKKYAIIPRPLKANADTEVGAKKEEFNKAYPDGIIYADKEMADQKAKHMSEWLGIALEVETRAN